MRRETHGQRYQAYQDWHEAQIIIAGAIFALVVLVTIIERMLGV